MTTTERGGAHRRRRKFTEQYRREAVELWQASGRTASEIGAQLGIERGLLYRWERQLKAVTSRGATAASTPEQLAEENAALRAEVARLTEQRDILKKSLGILSEPPLRGMPKSKS